MDIAGDTEESDAIEGTPVGIDVGVMGTVGEGTGSRIVGDPVGAGEGFLVRTSFVTDATVRPEMPSAVLAAASNALELRDDSTSLEYATDE